MSARECTEIADPQSLFLRQGKPRGYSLFTQLLMGQERFVNGKDG
jgi:hypothetical protein